MARLLLLAVLVLGAFGCDRSSSAKAPPGGAPAPAEPPPGGPDPR